MDNRETFYKRHPGKPPSPPCYNNKVKANKTPSTAGPDSSEFSDYLFSTSSGSLTALNVFDVPAGSPPITVDGILRSASLNPGIDVIIKEGTTEPPRLVSKLPKLRADLPGGAEVANNFLFLFLLVGSETRKHVAAWLVRGIYRYATTGGLLVLNQLVENEDFRRLYHLFSHSALAAYLAGSMDNWNFNTDGLSIESHPVAKFLWLMIRALIDEIQIGVVKPLRELNDSLLFNEPLVPGRAQLPHPDRVGYSKMANLAKELLDEVGHSSKRDGADPMSGKRLLYCSPHVHALSSKLINILRIETVAFGLRLGNPTNTTFPSGILAIGITVLESQLLKLRNFKATLGEQAALPETLDHLTPDEVGMLKLNRENLEALQNSPDILKVLGSLAADFDLESIIYIAKTTTEKEEEELRRNE